LAFVVYSSVINFEYTDRNNFHVMHSKSMTQSTDIKQAGIIHS